MITIDQFSDALGLTVCSICFSSRSSYHRREKEKNRIADQDQHVQKSIDEGRRLRANRCFVIGQDHTEHYNRHYS